MQSIAAELPRWDLSPFFPGIESDAFLTAHDRILALVSKLEQTYDRLGVREGGAAGISELDEVLNLTNDTLEEVETFQAYLVCSVSADTRDESALRAESELDPCLAQVRRLLKQLTAWLGGLDLQDALAKSDVAKGHEYALVKAQVASQHLLSPAEESIVSEMELTGAVAWGKLYSAVSSQIEVVTGIEGQPERLPMSAVRALASDPDRRVREAAYEAELTTWKQFEVPLAAAMNGVKGEVQLLATRRGWSSALDEACFGANIDRETLEAMMVAAQEAYPTFRRYLRAKARALRVRELAFFDLFAPLPGSSRTWVWEDALNFVSEQFDRYSVKLGDLARRSAREDWIDAGPRPGKVGGAFCSPMRGDESRVLMNYKPTFDAVRTLAHELGHAYHNVCLADRTPIQRWTPMTLAETASIFCETIVKDAVLQHGSDSERLAVLEASLGGACQVVVDISSRFLFEQSVFETRARRELAPRELCEAMLKAQRETYGDGLDQDRLHPYMWAAKPHYYGSSFYNFPYMFGLLFGLGLYAQYKSEPTGFQDRYDTLLSSTGLADAATLAGGFGIDLKTPDFWRSSLKGIEAEVDLFEQLI